MSSHLTYLLVLPAAPWLGITGLDGPGRPSRGQEAEHAGTGTGVRSAEVTLRLCFSECGGIRWEREVWSDPVGTGWSKRPISAGRRGLSKTTASSPRCRRTSQNLMLAFLHEERCTACVLQPAAIVLPAYVLVQGHFGEMAAPVQQSLLRQLLVSAGPASAFTLLYTEAFCSPWLAQRNFQSSPNSYGSLTTIYPSAAFTLAQTLGMGTTC